MTRTHLKDLVYKVNGAAIEVHKSLGPGLLESIYHACMAEELEARGIEFQTNLIVPVVYKRKKMNVGLRCDLFIEGVLVVELKAVESILPVHTAQLMTYMKLLEAPIGLMLNFHVDHIFRSGQKTYVNELYRELPE